MAGLKRLECLSPKSFSQACVILAMYHKATANAEAEVASKEKMSACLSCERCNVNVLWFKVMRTPASPIEIEPVKMPCFLCLVFCGL